MLRGENPKLLGRINMIQGDGDRRIDVRAVPSRPCPVPSLSPASRLKNLRLTVPLGSSSRQPLHHP